MNFPFTEVDFTGEDPSAPIIPSANGATNEKARPTNKKNKSGMDTSQVTNSKARVKNATLLRRHVVFTCVTAFNQHKITYFFLSSAAHFFVLNNYWPDNTEAIDHSSEKVGWQKGNIGRW